MGQINLNDPEGAVRAVGEWPAWRFILGAAVLFVALILVGGFFVLKFMQTDKTATPTVAPTITVSPQIVVSPQISPTTVVQPSTSSSSSAVEIAKSVEVTTKPTPERPAPGGPPHQTGPAPVRPEPVTPPSSPKPAPRLLRDVVAFADNSSVNDDPSRLTSRAIAGLPGRLNDGGYDGIGPLRVRVSFLEQVQERGGGLVTGEWQVAVDGRPGCNRGMGVARYGKGGLSTDRAALDEAVSAGVKSIEQYVRDIVRPTGITC